MSIFAIIQQSTTGVVQTFGRFTRLVGPGLRFKIPFIQKITMVSNRLQQETFIFEVKTKDNVFTKLGLAIQYKIESEDTDKAFFQLNNPREQIDSYVENVVRSHVPKMLLNELFESQDEICHTVNDLLKTKMKSYGYTIENTLVTTIDPDPDVKTAMNKINANARLREASIYEAETFYIKQLKEAEADRDRKRLQGEGISQQRLAILSGYEESVNAMAVKFGVSAKEIINFVQTIQELDTMERIGQSPNTKVLFFERKMGLSNVTNDFILANEASKEEK